MDTLTFAASAFAGTFVSEDLTCIAVGLLAAAGQADLAAGLAGCLAGIVVSDAALWLVGRAAGGRVRRWLPADRVAAMEGWLDRHLGGAVLAARFLPGARLPLYLTAGAVGRNGGRFLGWSALAALVWTPLLVLAVALLGEAAAGPLRRLLGGGPALATTALLAFGLVRLGVGAASRDGRARWAARVARLRRWEFWPAWLVYLPVLPYYAWLSVRHRGLAVWTAANPGIPAGGVVGESKFDILSRLPADRIIPSLRIPAGGPGDRMRSLRRAVGERGWGFPLVLKPDAGQRGAGVRKALDFVDAEKYLLGQPGDVLVQPYHPGPFEAGVFYYRFPGAATGRIFSITDKRFPVLAGDGRSTLAELVRAHPRFRFQAGLFLKRHAARANDVLADGERIPLAVAGNHCQGTMFVDGSHLWTPDLERAVDSVARTFPGFFIGRFDVRYGDVAAFRAGTEFAIVELNGATGESTNIYDPTWPLLRAYRTLLRQWDLLFRIGAENRRRGHRPISIGQLLRLLRDNYAGRTVDPLSD